MNQYETVFILTPVLSDVQMKEAVEKFKGTFFKLKVLRLSMKKTGDLKQIGLSNSRRSQQVFTNWLSSMQILLSLTSWNLTSVVMNA